MSMAAILGMWPAPFNKFLLPHPKEAPLWNLASIGPVVSEEMFENVDIHTYIHAYIHTHIHTRIHTYTHIYIHTYINEASLYYQLTSEPKGSGELKKLLAKEIIYIQWSNENFSVVSSSIVHAHDTHIWWKPLENLLLRNHMADELETWYAASGARVLPCLFK